MSDVCLDGCLANQAAAGEVRCAGLKAASIIMDRPPELLSDLLVILSSGPGPVYLPIEVIGVGQLFPADVC